MFLIILYNMKSNKKIPKYAKGGLFRTIGDIGLGVADLGMSALGASNVIDEDNYNTKFFDKADNTINTAGKIGGMVGAGLLTAGVGAGALGLTAGAASKIGMAAGLTQGIGNALNPQDRSNIGVNPNPFGLPNKQNMISAAIGGKIPGNNNKLTEYYGNPEQMDGINISGKYKADDGEASYKNYMFSNRLPKTDKLSFADVAKKIDKTYSKRLGDKISDRGRQRELDNLRTEQETLRGLVFGGDTTRGTGLSYMWGGADEQIPTNYFEQQNPAMAPYTNPIIPTNALNNPIMKPSNKGTNWRVPMLAGDTPTDAQWSTEPMQNFIAPVDTIIPPVSFNATTNNVLTDLSNSKQKVDLQARLAKTSNPSLAATANNLTTPKTTDVTGWQGLPMESKIGMGIQAASLLGQGLLMQKKPKTIKAPIITGARLDRVNSNAAERLIADQGGNARRAIRSVAGNASDYGAMMGANATDVAGKVALTRLDRDKANAAIQAQEAQQNAQVALANAEMQLKAGEINMQEYDALKTQWMNYIAGIGNTAAGVSKDIMAYDNQNKYLSVLNKAGRYGQDSNGGLYYMDAQGNKWFK